MDWYQNYLEWCDLYEEAKAYGALSLVQDIAELANLEFPILG